MNKSPGYLFHRILKTKKHEFAHVSEIKDFYPQHVNDFDKSKFYLIKSSDGKLHRTQILQLAGTLSELQAKIEITNSRWKYIRGNDGSFTEEETEDDTEAPSEIERLTQAKMALVKNAKKNADKNNLNEKIKSLGKKVLLGDDSSEKEESSENEEFSEKEEASDKEKTSEKEGTSEKEDTFEKEEIDMEEIRDKYSNSSGTSTADKNKKSYKRKLDFKEAADDCQAKGKKSGFERRNIKTIIDISDEDDSTDEDNIEDEEVANFKKYKTFTKKTKSGNKVQRIHLGNGFSMNADAWEHILQNDHPAQFAKQLALTFWPDSTLVNRYIHNNNPAGLIQLPNRSPRKVLSPLKKKTFEKCFRDYVHMKFKNIDQRKKESKKCFNHLSQKIKNLRDKFYPELKKKGENATN